MQIKNNAIKLDTPTVEIHVYGAILYSVKQDKLGRVYIRVTER
jgi:hypothetical protein